MSLTELNVQSFRMINDLGKMYPFLNPPVVLIAEYLLYLLIIAAVLFTIVPKIQNRLMVVCSLLAVAAAMLLRIPVSMLHSNLQPFAELQDVNQLVDKTVGNSFPSDHTILIFSLCVTFALFQKSFAWLWLSLAITVGILRVWVGVHYPVDVLAGALIATLSAVCIYVIVPKLVLAKWPTKQPN